MAQLTGKVVEAKTSKGVPKLKVEVWDEKGILNRVVGYTTTNAAGIFKFNLTAVALKNLFGIRNPLLYFKVYRNSKLLRETKKDLLWDTKKAASQLTIAIEGVKEIPFNVNILCLKPDAATAVTSSDKTYVDDKLKKYFNAKVAESMGSISDGLKKAIENLNLDYKKYKDNDIQTVIHNFIVPALSGNATLRNELSEIEKRGIKQKEAKIADLLYLDKVISDNPIFSTETKRLKILELAKIVKLNNITAAKIADKEIDLSRADEESWNGLIKEGVLTKANAAELQKTVELAKLTGDNFKFVSKIKTANFSSIKDLVSKDKSDWLKIIKDTATKPPLGETQEEYAENIVSNLEAAYPTEFFFYRKVEKPQTEKIKLISNVQPLLKKSKKLFVKGKIAEINWSGITPDKKSALEKDLEVLKGVANTYKYLGVADILNDTGLDVLKKQQAITKAIGNLSTFYKFNPDLNLKSVNFFESANMPADTLKWGTVPDKERPAIRKQLMAYQRTLNLADTFDKADKLLAGGFDSSGAITSIAESEFRKLSGLNADEARVIYKRAMDSNLHIAATVSVMRDLIAGGFSDLAAGNNQKLVNDLKEIDGYEDLFGAQNYCFTEEHKSIFSPAAYFVDLMHFVEKHVSDKLFIGANAGHPLYLKKRRPDLWTTKMDKENTYDMVSYPEIINDILEDYLNSVLSGSEDVYDKLSKSQDSFAQPFNLPLEELRIYLSHFDLKLVEIYKLLKEELITIARERLNISNEELEVITQADLRGIHKRYGSPGGFPLPVISFLQHTGLTRDELTDLVALDFFKSSNPIKVTKKKVEGEVQQYEEMLENVNPSKLDLIHRFIRLQRKLTWTLQELDLFIKELKAQGISSGLNKTAIINIANWYDLQTKLNISVEELCSLFSLIPKESVKQEGKSLFERLFAPQKWLGTSGSVSFYHAFFDNTSSSTSAGIDANMSKLLAGLGVSESELLQLLQFLKSKLGISNSGTFILNHEKLSFLYRYTKLAKALNISLTDLLTASSFVLGESWIFIEQASQIEAILDFLNCLKGSGLSIAEIKAVLNRELEEEYPWEYLIDKLALKDNTARFIEEHTTLFDTENIQHWSLNGLKRLLIYKRLTENDELLQNALHDILINYEDSSDFSLVNIAQLGILLEYDAALIQSLLDSELNFSGNGLEVIAYLEDCLKVCDTLGINGTSLNLLKQTQYSNLKLASATVFSAFKAKYSEETEWSKAFEPFKNKINALKRNALCDYIFSQNKELKFNDMNDLYNFFLIDVEMSGEVKISRLKAAISSVQLYIHRCLINLEQSRTNISIKVDPNWIPQEEWEWRKNYRVWEANRKVFLYPENYIEPELRDNKTPVFKQLEEEILQEKISQEAAEDAYKKYLAEFSKVANLQVAGSYYEPATDSNPETLHLFGRTNAKASEYYYRKYIGYKEWTPWEKIELSINAPYVAPIIYRGKLYLCWVEVQIEEKMKDLKDGTTELDCYQYQIDLKYSYLNESKEWITPQQLEKLVSFYDRSEERKEIFENSKFYQKCYPIIVGNKIQVTYMHAPHINPDPLEEFHYEFDRVLSYGNKELDLYKNELEEREIEIFDPGVVIKLYKSDDSNKAALGIMTSFSSFEAQLDKCAVVKDKAGLTLLTNEFNLKKTDLDINIVANKTEDSIIRLKEQEFLIRSAGDGYIMRGGNPPEATGDTPFVVIISLFSKREMVRLTTSLANDLSEKLYTQGLDEFLSLSSQRIREKSLASQGISCSALFELLPPCENIEHIDFTGAYGVYYRELFFHIPALIANHLNANQKFEEAKYWYEKIFNPTAKEESGLAKATDRNWRYIEFRNLDVKKLKEILTDKEAIEQYKKDPFNPHAIARLRMNAYQKNIVMKYIDNLLDWADELFAQDTFEAINEAIMLYILAADILGKRPQKLGKCETLGDAYLTYEHIGAFLKEDSDFLITLENWLMIIPQQVVEHKNKDLPPAALVSLFSNKGKKKIVNYNLVSAYNKFAKKKVSGMQPPALNLDIPWGNFGSTLIKQSIQVFGIPQNEILLSYWDRVEDRLFKIRNGMNIQGVRRQLALFQPPIDPALLVRAKAAGLTMEDILDSLSAVLPAYRFTYLAAQAKEFTATVQSFGSALLSALEKKDMEELNLLRSVNEQNILKLTRNIKKQQIAEATAQWESLKEVRINSDNRKIHYENLIRNGLNSWERTQQVGRHLATTIRSLEAGFRIADAILYLLPNVGSPFAMTYGGRELGSASQAWSELASNMASIADSMAASAGLEAGFQRREEEWQFSKDQAEQELKDIDKRIIAADIRRQITEMDYDVHKKQMEQAKEVQEFYRDKFTNLGLYNYLATSLTRIYREAYQLSYQMAQKAEQAYVFETSDETMFIETDNWQGDRGGLLAAERLMLQIKQMEKSFMEKNVRDHEVTQSFSLRQIKAEALVALQETGTCEVTIPEVIFDLFYPGQYKRRIKSVRLTIPCITGPFTNVGCKLMLLNSWVRQRSDGTLEPVSEHCTTSVATSNANNDGGVFELNFRDERYLPFEGAGAVSSWKMELPSVFRAFDYGSISDVIIHVSYTAKDDAGLKETIESNLRDSFIAHASAYGLFRLFSLKQEFSTELHRLFYPPTEGSSQETLLSIDKKNFPYFLRDKNIRVESVKVLLKLKAGASFSGKLALAKESSSAARGKSLTVEGDLEGILSANYSIGSGIADGESWKLKVTDGSLVAAEIEDIALIFYYTIGE